MIVMDSSAVIAILRDEQERQRFIDIIDQSEDCFISAANVLETRIVLHNSLREGSSISLDAFFADTNPKVVDVTRKTSDIAFEAFLQFGKGQGKGAGLNFGDCFSYALAKEMDLPLLFKGNDFARTDIRAATQVYS
jgi:ribonuclease VapC